MERIFSRPIPVKWLVSRYFLLFFLLILVSTAMSIQHFSLFTQYLSWGPADPYQLPRGYERLLMLWLDLDRTTHDLRTHCSAENLALIRATHEELARQCQNLGQKAEDAHGKATAQKVLAVISRLSQKWTVLEPFLQANSASLLFLSPLAPGPPNRNIPGEIDSLPSSWGSDPIPAARLLGSPPNQIDSPATGSSNLLPPKAGLLTREILALHREGISFCSRETLRLWRDFDFLTMEASRVLARSFLVHLGLLGAACLVVLFGFLFLPQRISRPIEELGRRVRNLSPTHFSIPATSTGVTELDDLDQAFGLMAEKVGTAFRLHSRYIEALGQIWHIFSSLHRDEADSGSLPSVGLEASLCQVITLAGEQVPQIALARVFRSGDGALQPLCPTYTSESFRKSDAFRQYQASTPDRTPIPLGQGVSGRLARTRGQTPGAIVLPEGEGQIEAVMIRGTEFGPDLEFERGLPEICVGISLSHQKGWDSAEQDLGFFLLYFETANFPITPTDWRFLTIISHQIVSLLETAELLQISRKERDITAQLGIARDIQSATIPPKPPTVPGLEIDAVIRMAYQVGGDYYDFFTVPDGRLGVVVGDVAGKNIPAALLTMVLKTSFKAIQGKILSPAQVLAEINRILIGIISESYFVTLVCAIIDPVQRSVTMANAGHIPPLLRSFQNGKVKVIALEIPSFPLGVISTTFREITFALKPNDLLLFCTDGVLDCQDRTNDRFGNDRLKQFLSGVESRHPAKSLLAEVDSFRGDRDVPDDITVLSVRLTGNATRPSNLQASEGRNQE